MAVQTQPNSPWFGVSMALLGVIVGYFAASVTGGGMGVLPSPSPTVAPSPSPTPTPTPAPPQAKDVKPIDKNRDHIRGNPDAAITIFEYSDFECPFCARHHPTMLSVMEKYGDDVNWVYRHFPLGFHPNAQKAAEATECVAEMGGNDKFWEYADLLFIKGTDKSKLADYAAEIGLDKAKIQECIDSGKYASYIATDMSEGSAAGVTGTPGNIIYNNKTKEAVIVSGAQPVSSFTTVIDKML